MLFKWRCPFCGHHAAITGENHATMSQSFNGHNRHGTQQVTWRVITCPNSDCGEYAFDVSVANVVRPAPNFRGSPVLSPRHHWQLVPEAAMKVMPDYVPAAIVADYKEACLIAEKSPRASATLSRRCLQGMLRDFWKVRPGRLVDEIKEIADRVDPLAWGAIDTVRRVGNIGAHMEADINVIVDVDPDEARLMVELLETLVDEWYVASHERQTRLNKLIETGRAKQEARKPVRVEPTTEQTAE